MFLSKYGVARTQEVPIIKRGVVDFAVGADWSPAAGDVKISKDGGAAANVTNLPTAIAMGNAAVWQFVLTAAEMQAARVVVTVSDAATKVVEDQTLIFETYGNASAQHAVDLADAVRMGLTALPNAAAEAAGGLYTRGTGAGQVNQAANGMIDANVVRNAGTAITAAAGVQEVKVASVAAGAINAAAIADAAIDAATFAAGAIDAAAIAADAIGASELATSAVNEIRDAILSDSTAFAGASVAAIKAKTDNLPSDPADASDIAALFSALPAAVWAYATRLLTAGTNIVLAKGTGVTGFNDVSAAQVNAEVVDALNVDTYPEPGQGAPAATASLAAKVGYLFKAWRNKKTQTATTFSLFDDAGTTVDQKSTVSDDGTTATRGEVSSGP